MKMVMAITPRKEAERLLQALVNADYTATYLETRGGMLRQAQMTLFTAVKDEDLDEVLSIIDATCHSEATITTTESEGQPAPMPAKPHLGGAVVFIWNIERSEVY